MFDEIEGITEIWRLLFLSFVFLVDAHNNQHNFSTNRNTKNASFCQAYYQ